METGSATMHDSGSTDLSRVSKGSVTGFVLDIEVSDEPDIID